MIRLPFRYTLHLWRAPYGLCTCCNGAIGRRRDQRWYFRRPEWPSYGRPAVRRPVCLDCHRNGYVRAPWLPLPSKGIRL